MTGNSRDALTIASRRGLVCKISALLFHKLVNGGGDSHGDCFWGADAFVAVLFFFQEGGRGLVFGCRASVVVEVWSWTEAPMHGRLSSSSRRTRGRPSWAEL